MEKDLRSHEVPVTLRASTPEIQYYQLCSHRFSQSEFCVQCNTTQPRAAAPTSSCRNFSGTYIQCFAWKHQSDSDELLLYLYLYLPAARGLALRDEQNANNVYCRRAAIDILARSSEYRTNVFYARNYSVQHYMTMLYCNQWK